MRGIDLRGIKFVQLGAAILVLISLSACSKLFGGLRKDFDDTSRYNSTSGGVWPERGMLDDSDLQAQSAYDDYNAVGHSERNPAQAYNPSEAGKTWVSRPNSQEYNRPTEQEAREQLARAKKAQGQRVKKADFWDDRQSEGSLWASGGQTNYFFTKNGIKSPGDIITLTVQEPFMKDIAAEVKRTLTEDEQEAEVESLKERNQRAVASVTADPKAAAPADPAASAANPAAPIADEPKDPTKVSLADVDLTKSIGMKTGDTMMAEIVERFPSGNYKIRGTKRVNYRGSQRLLSFVGIARANDITETDTMDSGKLYEYRLNVQP